MRCWCLFSVIGWDYMRFTIYSIRSISVIIIIIPRLFVDASRKRSTTGGLMPLSRAGVAPGSYPAVSRRPFPEPDCAADYHDRRI